MISQVTYREDVSDPPERQSMIGSHGGSLKTWTLNFYQGTGEDSQIYCMTTAIICLTNQPLLSSGRPRGPGDNGSELVSTALRSLGPFAAWFILPCRNN